MIDCEYYVPAWEGNKTSGPQPDFCLKYKISLNGNCIKSCEIQTKLVSEGKDHVYQKSGVSSIKEIAL